MFLEVYYRRDRPDPFVHWNMGHDVRPLNAYAAKYVGSPSGDDILAFGADRFDNSGTAFIGFAAADGRFRKGPLATDAYLLLLSAPSPVQPPGRIMPPAGPQKLHNSACVFGNHLRCKKIAIKISSRYRSTHKPKAG